MDIREPVGLLFLIVGALLLGYGLLGDAARVAGHNLDALWGAVMLLSGAVLRLLAWKAGR